MKQLLTVLFLAILLSSCSKATYYIVRHAEKAAVTPGMTSDVPLSEAGLQRAEKLKELLKDKNVVRIYSTNTIRTTSTAKPLSNTIGVPIQIYSSHKDTLHFLIQQLNEICKRKRALIVGHSNTVDDIINKLTRKPLLSDLQDSEYSNLFIVKRKGKKYRLVKEKY